jgi:hypothetical protein
MTALFHLFVSFIEISLQRGPFIEMNCDRKLPRIHFDYRRRCFE